MTDAKVELVAIALSVALKRNCISHDGTCYAVADSQVAYDGDIAAEVDGEFSLIALAEAAIAALEVADTRQDREQGSGASADADQATQAPPGAATASPPSGECPSRNESIPGWEHIIPGDDGVFIFWPDEAGGAYNAGLLRAIARELDRLNEIVFARWERHYAAIAMEAQRGAAGNTDATAEGGDSAGPKDIAHDQG